jgi:hypothetical protein
MLNRNRRNHRKRKHTNRSSSNVAGAVEVAVGVPVQRVIAAKAAKN